MQLISSCPVGAASCLLGEDSVKQRGATDRHPPRLTASPPEAAPPLRRLQRATTPGLGLVLGLERTEDVADAAPRAHQLRLVPKAEPHETLEHPNLCLDRAHHRLEIPGRSGPGAPCPAGAPPRGARGLSTTAA